MFQGKHAEKIRTHVLCSVIPPPENSAVYENVEEKFVEIDRSPVIIQYDKVSF